MERMKHYLEYCELMEYWSHEELAFAWEALHNHEIQEELYEKESPLLVFLIDSSLQEQLFLYFEDIERDKNLPNIYDW